MRDLLLTCSLALALSSGCYASHGRGSLDGGIDSVDARPPVDAARDGSWHRDALPTCAEGARCDDGDACTTDDRCRDGECTGAARSCESPPSACFAPIGACVAGECVYEFTDGARCDDADACTIDDVCVAGACGGAPLVCDTPPPAVCLDDITLQTFDARGTCAAASCSYAYTYRRCHDGCAEGACRCVPSPWAFLVVDTPRASGPGPGPDAIALDASGGIHVVYPVHVPGTGPFMHYAHRAPGSGWRTERLGAGWRGTIAIDPVGAVHIVYVDAVTTGMTHLERALGASWIRTTVPIGDMGAVGSWIVMAIDHTGIVHVAFSDLADTLVHASRSTAGVWSTGERAVLGARYLSAAAVDASGGFHVSYAMHHYEQRHAYRSPTGSWSSSTTGQTGSSTSDVAIDRAGGTHMLYTTASTGTYEVSHAYLASPGGAWVIDELEGAHEYGASIALEDDGVVHALFRSGDDREARMRHAWRDGSGTWSSEEVPAPRLGSGGLWTSLAIDDDDWLHVVFATEEHALVYGRRRICL